MDFLDFKAVVLEEGEEGGFDVTPSGFSQSLFSQFKSAVRANEVVVARAQREYAGVGTVEVAGAVVDADVGAASLVGNHEILLF